MRDSEPLHNTDSQSHWEWFFNLFLINCFWNLLLKPFFAHAAMHKSIIFKYLSFVHITLELQGSIWHFVYISIFWHCQNWVIHIFFFYYNLCTFCDVFCFLYVTLLGLFVLSQKDCKSLLSRNCWERRWNLVIPRRQNVHSFAFHSDALEEPFLVP